MAQVISFAILLLAIGHTLAAERAKASSREIKEFYAQLDPGTYDKHVRPGHDSGEPVTVNVSIYIVSFNNYDEKEHKVTVDLYFRQYWRDSRLAHSGSGIIVGGQELLQSIWTPDTFIASSPGGRTRDTMSPNGFVRVSPNGDVLASQRLLADIGCSYYIPWFPVDSLVCGLDIESYGFSMTDITYSWNGKHAVSMDPSLYLLPFKILGQKQMEKKIELTVGSYSRLVAEIVMSRRNCSFIIKYYLPLLLLTSLSLATYCLKKSLARLLLTALSSLGTVLTYVVLNQSLPAASLVTLFDYFGIGCIVFSVIALVHEVVQKDGSGSGSEAQKVGSDGEVIGSFTKPQTLRDRVIAKAVPVSFAVLVLVYIITCASLGPNFVLDA